MIQTQTSQKPPEYIPFVAPFPARTCLQPFVQGGSLGPQDELSRLSAALDEHERFLVEADEKVQDLRKQGQGLKRDILIKRYEVGCFLVYAEARRLPALQGCQTWEGLVGLRPEGPIKKSWVAAWVQIAQHIPEHVVLSGRGSQSLLRDVAALEEPGCIEMLCGHILQGLSAEVVRCGITAAQAAQEARLPNAVVIERAREAIKRFRRRKDGATLTRDELLAALAQNTAERWRLRLQARELGLEEEEVAEALGEGPEPPEPGPGGGTPSPSPPPAGEQTGAAKPVSRETDKPVSRETDKPVSPETAGPASPGEPGPSPPGAAHEEHEEVEEELDQDQDEEEEEVPPRPALRPLTLYPHQRVIAYGYPDIGTFRLSDPDRLACQVIAASAELCSVVDQVVPLRLHDWVHEILDDRICLYLVRTVGIFRDDFQRVIDALKEPAALGEAELLALFREQGGDLEKEQAELSKLKDPCRESFTPPYLRPLLPLGTGSEPALAQGYLTFDVVEPYSDTYFPEPMEERKQVFLLLSLIQCTREALLRYENSQGDVTYWLSYQLRQALRDAGIRCRALAGLLWERAERAREEDPEWVGQVLAAQQHKAQVQKEQQARIVVMGDEQLTTQRTVLGRTLDGIPVAITQRVAQFLVANGQQGYGKTQVAMNIREGCHLPLDGLTEGQKLVRTVEFLVDFNRGQQDRHPPLCGLYQNPYERDWQTLYDQYGVRFSRDLARFPRIDTVVLPGQKTAFEARYPHLGERGLVVHELGFHPEEQGSLFYRMMLSVGTQGNGKVRTQGRTLIEGIIGNLGLGRDPQRILQELEQAKFKGLNEKAVREQMKFITRMTTREGEHLRDRLLVDAPLLFVLESKDHGPEQMLPLEVAIMATLSGVLRDGSNPLRWIILHEMAKQGLHEVVAPYLIENAAQIRAMVRNAATGG